MSSEIWNTVLVRKSLLNWRNWDRKLQNISLISYFYVLNRFYCYKIFCYWWYRKEVVSYCCSFFFLNVTGHPFVHHLYLLIFSLILPIDEGRLIRLGFFQRGAEQCDFSTFFHSPHPLPPFSPIWDLPAEIIYQGYSWPGNKAYW